MSDKERRVVMDDAEIAEVSRRLGPPSVRYTVKISRVIGRSFAKRTWTTVGQKRQDSGVYTGREQQASDLVDEYGYVDEVVRSDESVTLYEQTTDNLDLRAVILAVNGEPT